MPLQFNDVQLASLELFCAAAEHNSFTRAAQVLGVTPATISRSVARLEARMNLRLFVRTTRQIRLTDAGRRYYEQCHLALAQLAEAERTITGAQVEPAGLLRISMPSTYGKYRLLPRLPAFRARYPAVRIEANVTNRNIDLVSEGYDLAIRVRPPTDANLIVRPLERVPVVVVATPDYLERAGIPNHPEQLAGCECIQFLQPKNGRPMPWRFNIDGQECAMETHGSYTCSDEILACVELARAGAGLTQCMRFLVEDDLASGRLVSVLDAFAVSIDSISLLYPHRRYMPLRTQVFIDFMLEMSAAARV
ncbi:LysR family transcriptional regulator [Nitrogeniibacter aestuarii]|uniref:LysR family transcriptional regulator n=1 Tax=Nitrogeniibacter aestuarii TaxID=2815343 RepID=UPI001E2C709C|nr:LysR family transcriptional regulator [Nitrogeniibacter aestuarii]